MTAYIYDTETTGMKEPQIIEAASKEVRLDLSIPASWQWNGRFKPSKPIELGALAAHHIHTSELENMPPSDSFNFQMVCPGATYLIGHNVDYDWEVSGRPGLGVLKRICTLAIARHLWPDLDSHSQTALLYHFYGIRAKIMVRNAHSALADVDNLQCLWYEHLLPAIPETSRTSWEAVWSFSQNARIPTRMPFGKHKGEALADVPFSYVQWYLKQAETDPYVVEGLCRAKGIKR